MSEATTIRRRRHPVRGAIFGFLFGLFAGIDLLLFGIVASDSAALVVAPLAGLFAGLVLGITTPIRHWE